MSKYKYFPVELHMHTQHSDGAFTVDELISSAKEFGYAASSISDHNTTSAYYEIVERDLNKNFSVLRGIEWTTFYGHFVITGATNPYDWTKLQADNLDECINELRCNQTIAFGIAHPFEIGTPICSGCYCEIKKINWNNIDYIELANSFNPQEVYANTLALKLWTDVLMQGFKLAAVTGADMHGVPNPKNNWAITMFGIENDKAEIKITDDKIVKAIRTCNTYVTLGPILKMQARQDDCEIYLGETIRAKETNFKIEIGKTEFVAFKKFPIELSKLVIYNNEKIIFEEQINFDEPKIFKLKPLAGYLRLEVVGKIKNTENAKLIISSPIFVYAD